MENSGKKYLLKLSIDGRDPVLLGEFATEKGAAKICGRLNQFKGYKATIENHEEIKMGDIYVRSNKPDK